MALLSRKLIIHAHQHRLIHRKPNPGLLSPVNVASSDETPLNRPPASMPLMASPALLRAGTYICEKSAPEKAPVSHPLKRPPASPPPEIPPTSISARLHASVAAGVEAASVLDEVAGASEVVLMVVVEAGDVERGLVVATGGLGGAIITVTADVVAVAVAIAIQSGYGLHSNVLMLMGRPAAAERARYSWELEMGRRKLGGSASVNVHDSTPNVERSSMG
jgi:hypothetical protein